MVKLSILAIIGLALTLSAGCSSPKLEEVNIAHSGCPAPVYLPDPSKTVVKLEVDKSQGMTIADDPNLMSSFTYPAGGRVTFSDGTTAWLQSLRLYVDEGKHKREIYQP